MTAIGKFIDNYIVPNTRMQEDLKKLGYDPGPINGALGAPTVDALKQFQQDRGLTADGDLTSQTKAALLKALKGNGAAAGGLTGVPGAQHVHAEEDGPAGATKAAKPAPNWFVPKLEITGGAKRELAVGGNLTVELTVSNWAKRPKGTMLDWSVSGGDKAVDIAFDKIDGTGALTVTGLAAGKGVVKVAVKVVGGGTYPFPDAVFTVVPTATNAAMWVPLLYAPHTLNREIPVQVAVTVNLSVSNWDIRPKGALLSWGAKTSGNAVDFTIEGHGGEGTLSVKGLEPGKVVVKADVTVKGGGTYPFKDIALTVINNTDPDSSPDQGGVANVTDLEQDMRILLEAWRSEVHLGIAQFVTNSLSKRIDDLESGSTKNFVIALLGNVVWAAACFVPVYAVFSVSLAGIAIAAAPTVPEKSKSFIPDIQKLMVDHIDGLFGPVNSSLRNKATALLAAFPGITRFHALKEFLAASFLPEYFKAKSHHTSIPILNKSAIRALYERIATDKLEEAIKADEARKAAEKAKKEAEYWKIHSRKRPGEV